MCLFTPDALPRILLLGLQQLSGEGSRWGLLIPDLLEPGVGLSLA